VSPRPEAPRDPVATNAPALDHLAALLRRPIWSVCSIGMSACLVRDVTDPAPSFPSGPEPAACDRCRRPCRLTMDVRAANV